MDEALKMALTESLSKADKAEGKPAAATAAAAEAKATATLERAELKEIKQDLKEFREVCIASHAFARLLERRLVAFARSRF